MTSRAGGIPTEETPGWIVATAIVGWVALLAGVLTHFDPASSLVTAWNSDSAIPVMMCNDAAFDAFDLYYWGQDRFGGWPWLGAQAIHRLLHFDWTPDRLFVVQAFWVLLSFWLLYWLHPRAGLLLAVVLGLVVSLSAPLQTELFAVSQPYGWQLTGLLFAYLSLLRLGRALESGGERARRWTAAALWFFSVLACWTSAASGPLLVCTAALEALRERGLSWRRRAMRLVTLLAPIVAGVLVELAFRAAFHRHGLRLYGRAFRTHLQASTSQLQETVPELLGHLIHQPAGWAVLSGWLLAPVVAVMLARQRSTEGVDGALGWISFGLIGMGALNWVMMSLLVHVAANGSDIRYLAPTFVLGTVGTAAGFIWIAGRFAPSFERWGAPALSPVLLGITFLALPARLEEPSFGEARRAEEEVVTRAPGTLLLGDYWDTYRIAALDFENRIPTLPLEGQWNRTPWHIENLKRASFVLVVGSARPLPWLFQHDVALELVDPNWAAPSPFRISRYAAVVSQRVPLTSSPNRFDPCLPSQPLALTLERAVRHAVLLVGTESSATGAIAKTDTGERLALTQNGALWQSEVFGTRGKVRELFLQTGPRLETNDCGYFGAAVIEVADGPGL